MKTQLNLLLVDDSPADRNAVTRLLAEHFPDAVITEAATIQDGIAHVRRRLPDCVVVDAELPSHASLGLLTAVKELDARIPVVALAGTEGLAILPQLLEAGAFDYVVRNKLMSVRLPHCVRNALALHAADERLQSLTGRDRRADLFLATLSHELRTPLNAVLGWSQLLASGSLTGSDLVKATTTIERNVVEQIRILDELLDASRVMRGAISLREVPIRLSEIVCSETEKLRAQADRHHLDLRVAIVGPEHNVQGDAKRLRQVVRALLSNAIKFTGDGGAVSVAVQARGDRMTVSVTDTGPGIERSRLQEIFEGVGGSEGLALSRPAGLGLSLTVVKHLVEAHGGIVYAESAGRDCGSTFTFELPQMDETLDDEHHDYESNRNRDTASRMSTASNANQYM